MDTATQTPWVFSNYGVPTDSGAPHYAWHAYDAGGYGADLWTFPATTPACLTWRIAQGLIYMNEGYWWDANRGVSSHNYWGAWTPDGLYTSRTVDGGTTWTGFGLRWLDVNDGIAFGTTTNNELVGGANGVAWVVTSGSIVTPQPEHFAPVDTTAAFCTIIVDSARWGDSR